MNDYDNLVFQIKRILKTSVNDNRNAVITIKMLLEYLK